MPTSTPRGDSRRLRHTLSKSTTKLSNDGGASVTDDDSTIGDAEIFPQLDARRNPQAILKEMQNAIEPTDGDEQDFALAELMFLLLERLNENQHLLTAKGQEDIGDVMQMAKLERKKITDDDDKLIAGNIFEGFVEFADSHAQTVVRTLSRAITAGSGMSAATGADEDADEVSPADINKTLASLTNLADIIRLMSEALSDKSFGMAELMILLINSLHQNQNLLDEDDRGANIDRALETVIAIRRTQFAKRDFTLEAELDATKKIFQRFQRDNPQYNCDYPKLPSPPASDDELTSSGEESSSSSASSEDGGAAERKAHHRVAGARGGKKESGDDSSGPEAPHPAAGVGGADLSGGDGAFGDGPDSGGREHSRGTAATGAGGGGSGDADDHGTDDESEDREEEETPTVHPELEDMYGHLWKDERTEVENAIHILKNYTKGSPVGRLFSGHPHRTKEHIQAVEVILGRHKTGPKYKTVPGLLLALQGELDQQLRASGKINPETGSVYTAVESLNKKRLFHTTKISSLGSRLKFIKQKAAATAAGARASAGAAAEPG